jgi:hypothetical protein
VNTHEPEQLTLDDELDAAGGYDDWWIFDNPAQGSQPSSLPLVAGAAESRRTQEGDA